MREKGKLSGILEQRHTALRYRNTHQHHRCSYWSLIRTPGLGSYRPFYKHATDMPGIDLRINPLISCRYSPGSFVIGTKGKFEINSFFDKPATCHSPSFEVSSKFMVQVENNNTFSWKYFQFLREKSKSLVRKIFFKSVGIIFSTKFPQCKTIIVI